MRTQSALPALLLVLCAVASACGGAHGAAADPNRPPPPKTTVAVESRKLVDVNLYALTGTRRLRLGTVPGMTTRNFVLPPDMVGNTDRIRFGIEIIGTLGHKSLGSDRTFESEQEMSVRPGDELSLTIY